MQASLPKRLMNNLMARLWMERRIKILSRWTRYSKWQRPLSKIRISPNRSPKKDLHEYLRSNLNSNLLQRSRSSRTQKMRTPTKRSPRQPVTILPPKMTSFHTTCCVWSAKTTVRQWWSRPANIWSSVRDAKWTMHSSIQTIRNVQFAARNTRRQFPSYIHELN